VTSPPSRLPRRVRWLAASRTRPRPAGSPRALRRTRPARSSPAPPGAHSVPKPPWFPGESRGILLRAYSSKIHCFQRLCVRNRGCRFCLPCRRSRVRIPSAAFRKTCICRSFSLGQSLSSSASGRTDSGLAADRSIGILNENALFAGQFWFVRTEVLLRPAEGRVFRLLRPLAGAYLQTARSCARTPARALPAIPILGGESDFSPETVRSTWPHSDSGEPWLPVSRPVEKWTTHAG
jgi:hypothetical protein